MPSIPPTNQCHCKNCRFDKNPKVFGGADIFDHFETQAHKNNQSDRDLFSLRQRVMNAILSSMDAFATKQTDYEAALNHYEYLSFEFRIVGHNQQNKCSCNPKDLVAAGCKCGGI